MGGKALLAVAALLSACGGGGSGAFKESIAQRFDADCRSAHAPSPKLARELDQLCACTQGRIRASDIAFGESDASINRKVQEAMVRCSQQVYGPEPPKVR